MNDPAAHTNVSASALAVERFEQTYVRGADLTSHQCCDYAASPFEFACRLAIEDPGLVLEYPGIAVRAG